ncbi:type IV conjugative transfer system lipoprotein TraV [Thiobacillus denitrificans]|uniref:type IV conjugative transfer system lipoprotein TraV n=1 Tax=Thiobacillus denitrificans TaxID=36861 RepID=UPI0003629E9F|nr:type IV conjugative transfer system lipoprotein TraV [Thiobacillus denitrificans]
MLKKTLILLSLGSVGALSGCGTIHGNYACGLPNGVTCQSLKETYNDTNGKLPPPAKVPSKDDKKTDSKDANQPPDYRSTLLTGQPVDLPKIEPGAPLRVEPRLLRIWYAPWEDQDRVFHDQSFAYVVVDDGRWLLSQNRNQLEMTSRIRMVIPPVNKAPVSEENEGKDRKPVMAPSASAAPNRAIKGTFDGATQSMEK